MTEELKKALESAKTEEEKKAVAEKFKEEIKKLTPEELDKIAGGIPRGVSAVGGVIYNQGDLTVWGGPWQ